MAISPFDITNHLYNKTPLEFEIKVFNPWMINKALSFNLDTILIANECNKYYRLDKQLQYDFLYHIIPKGKRYGKWIKKVAAEEDINILTAYYNINKQVAMDYLALLTEEQMDIIRIKMRKGGVK